MLVVLESDHFTRALFIGNSKTIHFTVKVKGNFTISLLKFNKTQLVL